MYVWNPQFQPETLKHESGKPSELKLETLEGLGRSLASNGYSGRQTRGGHLLAWFSRVSWNFGS